MVESAAIASEQPIPEWVDRLSWFHARIRQALDAGVGEVLQFAVDAVATLLAADQASLHVFEPSIRDVRRSVVGGPQPGLFRERPYDGHINGPSGMAFAHDSAVIVDPHVLTEQDRTMIGSMLIAPIPLRAGTTATIAVVNGSGSRTFVKSDVTTMSIVAHELGMLIDSHERLAAEKSQRRLAESLREVTSSMVSSLDFTAVLGALLNGLEPMMQFTAASVLLREGEMMRVMATHGIENATEIQKSFFKVASHPILKEVVETQGHVVVHGLTADQAPVYAGIGNIEHFIAMPLVSRNRVIGVLTVSRSRGEPFDLEELIVLDAFSVQGAVAIQNARLFQSTQESLAKTETLYQTAQALIAFDSLTEMLQTVVDGAARSIPARQVSLQTVSLRERRIIHFVRGGEDRNGIASVNFEELWDGLGGWVLRNKEPVISNADDDERREGALARKRARNARLGSRMVVPVRFRGKLFGVMQAAKMRGEPDFDRRDLELLGAMANQAAMAVENARLFDEVQRLANTDELTGLSNRRDLFDRGQRELDRSVRSEQPVSALMLDIDSFKAVNDTHGHSIGDEVLREIAARIQGAVRDVDIVGRYGGEEFAVVLPETELDIALVVAERVRNAISNRPFETGAGSLDIRASLGVAQADKRGGETIGHLLDRADTAMYVAKTDGGDLVKAA